MESPLVTAFIILLKLMNIPMPAKVGNSLFKLFEILSSILDTQNFIKDLAMDPNPTSYSGGKGSHENTFDFIIGNEGKQKSVQVDNSVEIHQNSTSD
jgi:hypothetical protein